MSTICSDNRCYEKDQQPLSFQTDDICINDRIRSFFTFSYICRTDSQLSIFAAKPMFNKVNLKLS